MQMNGSKLTQQPFANLVPPPSEAEARRRQFAAWGKRLKGVREKRGLSWREVAQRAGMEGERDKIRFFEEGSLYPKREELIALCHRDCLGRDLLYFDDLLPEDVRLQGRVKNQAPPPPPPTAEQVREAAIKHGALKQPSYVEAPVSNVMTAAEIRAPEKTPGQLFGAFLKAEREKVGMSASALSVAMGVSGRSISNWEEGEPISEVYYNMLVERLPGVKNGPPPVTATRPYRGPQTLVKGSRQGSKRWGHLLRAELDRENQGKGGPMRKAVPVLAELLGVTPGVIRDLCEGKHPILRAHYNRVIELFPGLKDAPPPRIRETPHHSLKVKPEDLPPPAPATAPTPTPPPPPPPAPVPVPVSAAPVIHVPAPAASTGSDLTTLAGELATLDALRQKLAAELKAVEAKIPAVAARLVEVAKAG